ncbi:MAG: SRPBCC family protein [Chloroflexota bacterium]
MNQNVIESKTGMLIRKPVAEVFEAFINPVITTQFWFTKSSGRLEVGKHIQWDWEMYNASTQVDVKTIEPNKRLVIQWSGYDSPTTVEWIFTSLGADSTFVSITESGFSGDQAKVAQYGMDSTGGFTLVLAGLKALLEHNIHLNLILDRFPKGIEQAG